MFNKSFFIISPFQFHLTNVKTTSNTHFFFFIHNFLLFAIIRTLKFGRYRFFIFWINIFFLLFWCGYIWGKILKIITHIDVIWILKRNVECLRWEMGKAKILLTRLMFWCLELLWLRILHVNKVWLLLICIISHTIILEILIRLFIIYLVSGFSWRRMRPIIIYKWFVWRFSFLIFYHAIFLVFI